MHLFKLKFTGFFHLDVMLLSSKFHDNLVHGLEDMLKSFSAFYNVATFMRKRNMNGKGESEPTSIVTPSPPN